MAHHKKSNEEQIIKCNNSVNEAIIQALSPHLLQVLSINQPPKSKQPRQKQPAINNDFLQGPSIFDRIPNIDIDESTEQKIVNLKLTHFTQKRKDELFKRFRKDQQQKITTRRKELEKPFEAKGSTLKLARNEFTLKNEQSNKTETFPVTSEDLDKLRPETDLNDTIVGNYIKMLNFVFLPPHLEDKCYFYSSFFMEKLIAEYVKDENTYEREGGWLIAAVKEKVSETYKTLKRWTRRVDIFQKEIVVFPINAFRHWFSIILLRPHALLSEKSGQKLEIVYCDSMFEKRDFIIAGVRKYIELELQEKRGIKVELSQANAPCYQLLLPRQTNTHDCGLYMISYIQELISRKKELQNLSNIKNRRKLTLFPRALIYTMRERLRKLFIKLTNASSLEEKNEILAEYIGEKQQIMNQAQEKDFDQISQRQCKKYQKMNIGHITGMSEEEKAFLCEIRFYLDTEINFYEKDR